jgi:hypothetical protein
VQHVEHIEDMSATSRTALGVSNDDIRSVQRDRMELGPISRGMDFLERGQPLFGPYGIADDRRYTVTSTTPDAYDAKAVYLNHMGEIVQGVAWADAIRRDFAAFRKAGLVNPLMTEIESSL